MNSEDEKILIEKFIDKFDFSLDERNEIIKNTFKKQFKKGEIAYSNDSCHGYFIVKSGSLRAFIITPNLKEMTVFELQKNDSCVFCSLCFMQNSQSEMSLQTSEDSEILLIPASIYKKLKDRHQSVTNYTLSLISTRFASIVNVMEQAIFLPLVVRVRELLRQKAVNQNVKITHEAIANHLGSAREAISRILKEMEKNGAIEHSRGQIRLK